MRILLTGASGMVGKNIQEHPSAGKYEFLTPQRAELDLLSISKVEGYLRREEPDFVIHAAGLVGGIQHNMRQPARFLLENSLIGMNLISTSQEMGIKNFMNLGSSCMYPRNARNPLHENMILKGELEPTNEGYALAKIMGAKLCEYISLENADFLYKTVIPCNLYGRHDKFDESLSHMIPAVLKKIHSAYHLNSSVVEIWGDGMARREFMYAGDFADFIFYAIENFSTMPSLLNVGLGMDYSIKEYYDAISNVIGFSGDFYFNKEKPTGMKQKLVDINRLESFGWSHQFSLAEGLSHTYQYYNELNNDQL